MRFSIESKGFQILDIYFCPFLKIGAELWSMYSRTRVLLRFILLTLIKKYNTIFRNKENYSNTFLVSSHDVDLHLFNIFTQKCNYLVFKLFCKYIFSVFKLFSKYIFSVFTNFSIFLFGRYKC